MCTKKAGSLVPAFLYANLPELHALQSLVIDRILLGRFYILIPTSWSSDYSVLVAVYTSLVEAVEVVVYRSLVEEEVAAVYTSFEGANTILEEVWMPSQTYLFLVEGEVHLKIRKSSEEG